MELCDQYIHEMIQLIPEMNDFYRLPEYNHLRHKKTNTFSKEFKKKELKLHKKYYKLVTQKQHKSFYDFIFLDDLKIILKEAEYELDLVPIDALENFPIYYISILQGEGVYLFTDKKSYDDFLERCKKIPEITNMIIQRMKKGIQQKDTLPKIVVYNLITQYSETVKMNLDTLKFPSHSKENVIRSIKKFIFPSILRLLTFLKDKYLCKCSDKIGISNINGGKTIYKNLLQEQTLQGYTPKQLHKLGKSEIKRILLKIKSLQKKMKFKGSIQDFYKYTTEPFTSKQELLTASKNIQSKIYKTIYPTYFEKSLQKQELAKIKPITDGNDLLYAFYIGKQNTFYVNTLNYDKINKNELLTLTLHETVPGHHLERFTHNNSKELPLYIKGSAQTGYTEGWGLYCENFTDIHTDKELVWKYVYELHRAVRLVVDTGIHAFNWSYDKTFTFMKQLLPYHDEIIKNEIIRYICDPSQALSYKVGELTFLLLRDKYLEKYPDDIKGYHKLIFEIGPCSLDSLLKEFIKKNIL